MQNQDEKVIKGFGEEWSNFDQSPGAISSDLENEFRQYFSEFPWAKLPGNSVGFDAGCGSGRWAKLVAPRVGVLHCCDPSAAALDVAKRNLSSNSNCQFHLAGVDNMPFESATMDFGYSLGVLHHIPDTGAGLEACARLLKPGAPFLVYLYYAFDNRPWWFKSIHRISEIGRLFISRLPFVLRYWVSQAIAFIVYLPLARLSALLEKCGVDVGNFPLSSYRRRSFYSMRTDALDRFGTRLEKRFSRGQIEEMMINAGLRDIRFREGMPYWCAVGFKK